MQQSLTQSELFSFPLFLLIFIYLWISNEMSFPQGTFTCTSNIGYGFPLYYAFSEYTILFPYYTYCN